MRKGHPQKLVRWAFLGISATLLPLGCQQGYTPKPEGYPRFETPQKVYEEFSHPELSYSFEIPAYAQMEITPEAGRTRGWANLYFPALNGTIHLSYKPVDQNLGVLIQDSRNMAYKHTVKADGIEESPFIDRENKRYGMVYDLSGNVASALQFFITDSSHHFLRGSLYFNCAPNQDSLQPVVEFIRTDLLHLIETTRWKYE